MDGLQGKLEHIFCMEINFKNPEDRQDSIVNFNKNICTYLFSIFFQMKKRKKYGLVCI